MRLVSGLRSLCFRVLQESLTNVHRHSGASEQAFIFNNFQYETDAVILEIRDFAKGIREERFRLLNGVSAESGVGLAGMRERLHELNGTLKLLIESDACGTSRRATVPLAAMARPLQMEDCGRLGESVRPNKRLSA